MNNLNKELERINKINFIKERLHKGRSTEGLITVNSISGGRSSAMMAAENRADVDIFAIVTTNYPQYHIKDETIRNFVWEKLNTDLIYATLENDDTLRSVMDLEQHIGREIIWVAGEPFDKLIEERKHLPNRMAQWCSYEMKIKPIFEYLAFNLGWFEYISNGEPIPEDKRVLMNIGYRIDDIERVADLTHTIKYAYDKHPNGDNKWGKFEWRIGNYPIIQKAQHEVVKYWQPKPVTFAEYNNCEFCHHRTIPQVQKIARKYPAKLPFWITMENNVGHTFRFDYSLKELVKLPVNMEIDFPSQTMCGSGACID